MLKRIGVVFIIGGLALAAPAAPAVAAVPQGLEYVALGDSYSAGFGLLPLVPGSPDGCYRAENNYPHRIAEELGFELTDVTCSGAVTANIDLTGQVTMNGVGPLPLQGDALSETTDIVTLTIGGNDLDFATVAEKCIRLAPDEGPLGTPGFDNCRDYYNPLPDVDLLIDDLDWTVIPALDRVYAYIAQKAPNAKVFVLGYPTIAPDAATAPHGCFSSPIGENWPNPPYPQDTVPYGTEDLWYLHHIENQLDKAIQAHARAHGFTYVNTWTGTAENTLCAGEHSGIFGIGFTDDPSDGQPLPIPDIYVKLGALHPNEKGVDTLATAAAAAIAAHADFADAPPTLPATGPQPGMTIGLGAALVGLGLVVLGVLRRRAPRPADLR